MIRAVMRPVLCSAVFAAAMCLHSPAAHAFGDAPWCAVIELGNDDAYWDCQYRTVEECVPHILAGSRGARNVNPWPGPQAPRAAAHAIGRKHHARRRH